MATAKLYKQGGSTVMAIPARYLKSLEWIPGTDLEVLLVGGDQILIRKLTQAITLKPSTGLWGPEKEKD